MKRRQLTIRTRLTLWHSAVFGLLTVGTMGVALAAFSFYLHRQLDVSLKEELEVIEQVLVHLPEGAFPFDSHPGPVNRFERLLELWGPQGTLIHQSHPLRPDSLGPPPGPEDYRPGFAYRSVGLSDGSRWRVASTLHEIHGRPFLLRLALSEDVVDQEVSAAAHLAVAGLPFLLGLVGALGYLMARRALKPIDEIVATARAIGPSNLADRITVINSVDELGQLSLTLNDLLGRVEESYGRLKRFTADASHQLRTPLTAMRSVGEMGLRQAGTKEEIREVVGSMLEENQKLSSLVEKLLFLARADAGSVPVTKETADIRRVVDEVVDLMAVLAEDRDISLTLTGPSDITVHIDRALVRQALMNLIDNAIKFSPPGSPVRVVVAPVGTDWVAVDVIDSGPGIKAEEMARVFDRFSTREVPGQDQPTSVGLGLSIAQWAVEVNGGTVDVFLEGGRGSRFRILLPVSPLPPSLKKT